MDLSKVKLRPTKTKENTARPMEVICKDSEDYHRLMEETFLETFLDKLSDCTFPASLLPCPADDILRAHEHDDVSCLDQLAKQLHQRAVVEKGWSSFFVRLSSRSPKDAALSCPQFRDVLRKHFVRIVSEEGADDEDSLRNCKLLALYEAATECLCCRSGHDAVSLLSRSHRIVDDLKHHGNALNIVVRPFVFFCPELEVRGFVWDGVMTALTQYNPHIRSKTLLRDAAKVQHACQEVYKKKIRPSSLELKRFAIDFVIVREEQKDTGVQEYVAYVVEVNPLAEFTGFGLFDFMSAKDRDILSGKEPFEFRCVETIPPLGDIAPDYKAILDNEENFK